MYRGGRYRVRFNLGRGKNYKKWQVRNLETKEVVHYDPEVFGLLLDGCRLCNNRRSAEKIYEGANKRVCSWVDCNEFKVTVQALKPVAHELMDPIYYNPRKAPHWRDCEGEDIDGKYYSHIYTFGKQMFV